MLLAVDVGNTQTVIGVYESSNLLHMWRMATNKAHTSDEVRMKLLSFLQSVDISAERIHGAALASVVPSLMFAWEKALTVASKSKVLICDVETAQGVFEATYPNFEELGADRIADSIAARRLYGSPVVVVDFGTATNIEVIDKDGKFVGGIIAPGFETSAQALFSRATKIAHTELEDPGTVLGKDTVQAVQAGILYGEVDRVDGLVNRVFDELGYKTPVVATGGLATRLAPFSKTVTEVDTELTLEGLRMLYEAKEEQVEDIG